MMETRQNSVQFQRPTYLPMLCSRPCIKNVTHPTKSHQEDTSTLQQKADPLSPKISCIGQVKRSNKIVGFPTTTTTITPAAHHRYFKLKRLFSGKNLTFSAPPTTTTACSNRSNRGRVKKEEFDNKRIVVIDVAELDPPLPVLKKKLDGAAAADKASVNLWKRRSGGDGCQLRSLQIHPNGSHHLKVTTV